VVKYPNNTLLSQELLKNMLAEVQEGDELNY